MFFASDPDFTSDRCEISMYINTLLSLFSFGPLLFFYGLRRPYYFSLMAGIADGDGRWWARVADGLGEDGRRRRGSLIKWPDRAHTVSVPPTEGVGPWAMARRRSLRRLHPLPRVSCSPPRLFFADPNRDSRGSHPEIAPLVVPPRAGPSPQARQAGGRSLGEQVTGRPTRS